MSRLISVDLGAESGRVMLGTLAGGRLTLEELHRFPTPSLKVGNTLRWDVPAIEAGIATGVMKAAAGGPVASIGVDTWGVDYGLIDAQGALLELPYCYRDARTEGLPAELHRRYGEQEFFARSGLPSLVFNTVFQLAAQVRDDRAALERAAACIPISDVFHQWLSGKPAWERTQVGTWGLATPGAAQWNEALLADLGIPKRLFGPITPTGTVLGSVRDELARAWGLKPGTQVVLPGGHDTASAVGGMGADPDEAAYLSSGTWSLIGCVAAAPMLSEEFRRAGYGNEIAVDGRVRLNKNIMGLWVVQECRRAFVAAGRTASYGDLATAAARLPSSRVPLDVDDQRFFASSTVTASMPERIAGWCREQQIPVPADDVAMVRLVLDGLAAAYRKALVDLETIAGRRFTKLNIVGGGSNNRLLNQLTADAIARDVVAGPGEATAIGSLLVQARALGLVKDAAEARAVLARSVELATFNPASRSSPQDVTEIRTGKPMNTAATPAKVLAELVSLSNQIGDPELDGVILGEGNTSAKVDDQTFLVKASGCKLRTMTAEDIVHLRFDTLLTLMDKESVSEADLSATYEKAKVDRAQTRRPSVEALFHALCLGLPGINFVGHTHATAVNGLTCGKAWQTNLQGRMFPDEAVVLGPDSVFVPYVDPGVILAKAISDGIARYRTEWNAVPKVIYMQNHGLIALGGNAQEVLAITSMAIKAARIRTVALTAGGGITTLDRATVLHLLGRPDELYRQRKLGLGT